MYKINVLYKISFYNYSPVKSENSLTFCLKGKLGIAEKFDSPSEIEEKVGRLHFLNSAAFSVNHHVNLTIRFESVSN